MALGHQLITSILAEEIKNNNVKCVKGIYTDKRNYKIACRFYYHFVIKGLQYERVLTVLNDEFNLSETRISQLIMLSRDHLEQLKKEKADRKTLQKKFPYYNWF